MRRRLHTVMMSCSITPPPWLCSWYKQRSLHLQWFPTGGEVQIVALLGLELPSEVSIGRSGNVLACPFVPGSPLVTLLAEAGPYRGLGCCHSPCRGAWGSPAEKHLEASPSFHHPAFHNRFFCFRSCWKQPRMSELQCKPPWLSGRGIWL